MLVRMSYQLARKYDNFRDRAGIVAVKEKTPPSLGMAGGKLVRAGPLTMKRLAAGTGGITFWESLVLCHFCADLLAQQINRHFLPVAFKLPIGPAVATWRAFQMRPDLMD